MGSDFPGPRLRPTSDLAKSLYKDATRNAGVHEVTTGPLWLTMSVGATEKKSKKEHEANSNTDKSYRMSCLKAALAGSDRTDRG